MSDQATFAPSRFATADLPEQDRIAVWREHYAQTVLRVDIEPTEDASFECALVSRTLPGLQLLSADMSAVRVTRSRALLADGNDDFALIINREGAIDASARGRQVSLREGDAALITSSDVASYDRHGGGSLSLRIPRSILAPLVVDVEDTVMRHISRHTDVLKLLTGYASALMDENTLLSPALRRSAITHVHDLVALTLGATRDATDVAKDRGVRAARLRSAKSYTMKNSNRRNLSIGVVAAHLKVTPRYLQRLFESEGSTFSAFLINQRLARAHRMLSEPRFAQCAVSEIAYEVGFGDLSYFNRSFKQRYGATPSDIRGTAGAETLRSLGIGNSCQPMKETLAPHNQ